MTMGVTQMLHEGPTVTMPFAFLPYFLSGLWNSFAPAQRVMFEGRRLLASTLT